MTRFLDDEPFDDAFDRFGEDLTWGEQLVGHAEQSTSTSRFLRGMTSWSEGAVGKIVVRVERGLGTFTADVEGTHRYQCVVAFPLLEEWEREVVEALVALRPPDAPHRTFPMDVLREQAVDAGCDLDPPLEEVFTGCTCPDDAEVCKHLVALFAEIAGIIDTDPWAWLKARGLSPASSAPGDAVGGAVVEARRREEELHVEREVARQAAVAARLADFWNGPGVAAAPLSEAPRPAHRERDPKLLVAALTARFAVRGRSRARAQHLGALEAEGLQALYDEMVIDPVEPQVPQQRSEGSPPR